jgi:hypothetical protein
MIPASDAKNSLLMTKKGIGGTQARPRLEALIKKIVDEPSHQVAQLFSLTNSAQVLFADKVLLTEGKTELRLLPFLFRSISGKTLGQASLALIAQSGKNDTRKSMQILDAMGIPSCAIVDLDYAFTSAVRDGTLQDTDSDLVACKGILKQMGKAGAIGLNPETQLPTNKDAPVSAAKAFEILAQSEQAKPHVTSLVSKLRAHRIWLWSDGAIEAHLGITAKKEAEWLAFQMRCDADGVEHICADYPSVQGLIQWISDIAA